ncbi:MAG TPA: S9 family peptidase, partial [Ktedonobacteraceae bacterium]
MMTKPQTASYGSWKSPITADLIVTAANNLGQIVLEEDSIYWIERRPSEGGRNAIVRRTSDGTITDLLPLPFNARTRVHEYGGGDFTVSKGVVYFSNFADQRLYSLVPGSEPVPISPARDIRFADAIVDQQRNLLFSVSEDHTDESREAVNSLISLPLTGDAEGNVQIIASGNDFYSSPRLSPDGSHLAWLTWKHPNMPWDGTELWVGDLDAQGFISNARLVTGGRDLSIVQPTWAPDGTLHFVSEQDNGWWNLYRVRSNQIEPLYPMEAEFGMPQWVFGISTYGFASSQRIICTYTQNGTNHLASLDTTTGELTNYKLPYTTIGSLQVTPTHAVFLAASPTEPAALIRLTLDNGEFEVLRRSREITLDRAYFSVPEAIEFPTEHGKTAHAFFYPPSNPDFQAPAGELPPLLVEIHGGPTSATSSAFNLSRQFWTSRGIAVLDVNYGGSTGFGREYRRRLNGQWGVVDVDDCVNGAKYLVERGLVDGKRLAITGGSAGGYTTLCALTFRDTFSTGASHFGVSDIEALAQDTHKFESRYDSSLIGPYPESINLYKERSPIYHTDRLSRPIIFFQGLEDKIVLPNQSERMVEALRQKGLPVAYVTFEGEQHGFRRAENIKRALEGE